MAGGRAVRCWVNSALRSVDEGKGACMAMQIQESQSVLHVTEICHGPNPAKRTIILSPPPSGSLIGERCPKETVAEKSIKRTHRR